MPPRMLEHGVGMKLTAFLACFLVYAVFLVAVLGSLLVPIYAVFVPQAGMPVYVVTALIAVYVVNVAVTRKELRCHDKWHAFAQKAPWLVLMRRYVQFEIADLPLKLREAEKKEGAQFVFAIGPHGADSMFRVLLEGELDKAFPNMHSKIFSLAASVLFMLPLVRELTLWTGCVDARRAVADKVLRKGNSILVIPGGEAEQLMTIQGTEALYIKHRKGFVRLAMTHAVPVVPAYCFGVNDTFYCSRFLYGPRHALMKTLGVCIPFAYGLWGSSMCPQPSKHTVVFGEPLTFPCKVPGEPTPEEVVAAHAQYMVEVEKLFDKHKGAMGMPERKLLLC